MKIELSFQEALDLLIELGATTKRKPTHRLSLRSEPAYAPRCSDPERYVPHRRG